MRVVPNGLGNEPGRPIRVSQETGGGADRAPALSSDLPNEDASFKAFIDDRRTLHIEGTDAAETIIAEVIGDQASITIEYRTGAAQESQKSSFGLDRFDRLILNARGGSDFVNIIDAAELLSAQKKVLKLDGGGADNIVVLSHLPFKPETARQMMQLQYVSKQIEDLAKRASEVTSQALTSDATRLIESTRVNLADVSRLMANDAEKQLFEPARELVERSGPRLEALGNSIISKSDDFAKQQARLVAELTKKYAPTKASFSPDDNREPPDAPGGKPDVDRSDSSVEEKEADGEPQADHLLQSGSKLGDDAKAQVERMGKRMENDAAGIEQRAAAFERRVEQLSAAADLLAARGEQDMTAVTARVLAVVAELKSMEESFREVGLALREELQMAASTSPVASQAEAAKVANVANVAGASCGSPIVTTNTYVGGPSTDVFIPLNSSQSWSITGGAGTDFLFGGNAADDINGGPGNDFVFGMGGNDHIHGNDGIDFLLGEFVSDNPSITGDDCIWGDNDTDLVVGDNFIDTGATPGGADELSGGKGIDIVIGDDVLFDIFSQTQFGGKDKLEGNDDIDLLFGCGGADNIKGNADIDFAEGNGGADVIEGGKGRNFAFCNTTVELGNLLLGGRGADKVTGGSGIDVIFGEQDADTLIGAGQVDLMFGGSEKDKMYGDAGGLICIINGIPIRLGNLMLGGTDADNMRAGGDLDAMFGQDGEDKIYGYDGSFQQLSAIDADWISGGNGNDYLEGDNESLSLRFSIDFIIGGPGNDDMRGGKLIDFMLGGTGADTMRGDSNKILLVTSIDLMFGGPDDDWMDGGNALDLMLGEGGNDTMRGDDERPVLISPDVMFGGPGADTMNGGSSFDFMSGEDDADHMLGDSNLSWQPFSSDFMLGGPGPDFMDGGNSRDFMWGGDGCDTMLGDNSTPLRISPDFMFGEAGNDDLDGGNSTDIISGGPDSDRVVGDRQFSSQSFSIDWLWGDDGCDTLLGGRALDVIFGGNGVDEIDGQRGPDLISGGPGSDTINGGDSLDVIWGDEGNDLIHGNDFLDLIRGGDGNDCIYGDDGPDSVWGNEGDDCIHGGDGPDHLRGNRDNDLIFGDNGWDRLRGGNGDDKLDGGAGFDLIFGGSGNDEGWRGSGGALFFSVKSKHSGSSGLNCNCQIDVCKGKICVHKFNDLNGDGIQNSGEPDLQKWVFQVMGPCDTVTLITDADGNACGDFEGTYTVVEQMQSGWTATTPTTVTVTAGQTTPVNFGNLRQGNGELCIYKFHDKNGNGVRDTGEPALPNWSFTVTNLSGASNTLVTDSLGRICKTFPPGTYPVVETPQTGWTATTPTTHTVTVTAGQTTNVTFGNKQQSNGELCIYKFHDLNGNGIRDTGEPVLPNWSFTVTNSSGASNTLLTDSLGRICKTFPPGTYPVVETPQTGWTATTPRTHTVTVTAGQTTDVTFGNQTKKGPSDCAIAPPGMVAWWPMDDPTGDSVVDDIVGAPDNGWPKPGPTIGPSSPSSLAAVVGTGLNFLPYAYGEVATSPEVNFGTGDFTIDAWIKLGQNGMIHPIVDKLDFSTPGTDRGYAFFVQGGNLGLNIGPASVGLVGGGSTAPVITPGTWHHVAVTVRRNDPSNMPVISFYINGVLSGSSPPRGSLMPGSTSIDTTTSLLIGGVSRVGSGGPYYHPPSFGEIAIDELEFFKRELNQTEIQAIFNAEGAGKCKCFVATNEKINCNSNGTFNYTFTFTNLSSSTVSNLVFSPVTSNVTITPASMTIPPLAPGGSTNVTVTIGGPGAVSGANVCFSVGLAEPLGAFVSCRTEHCITLTTCAANGSLTVTKIVKNQWAMPFPAGTNFPITVSCLPPGPTVTLNLAAGASQTVNNIPVGSNCTVTEGALPPPIPDPACASLGWGTPTYAPGQTVTIPSTGGSQTVTVTNTYFCNTISTCATPPAGMVGWWPLDEVSGAIGVNDRAGFNNQGVPKPGGQVGISGPSPTVGEVNGALYFAGPYVEVPTHTELDFGQGDFSIDAWVRPVDCSRGGGGVRSPIVDKFNGTTGFSFYLDQPTVGLANLYVNINGSTFVSSGTIPTLGSATWSHVAVTVNRPLSGTAVGTFYINGLAAGTFTPPSGSMTNALPMWIGNTRIAGSSCEIAIDEIELFNRALHKTEVNTIFDAGSAGKCKPTPGTGTIIIRKNTVGRDAMFGYTTGTGLSAFSITTSGRSGSQTFSNISPGPTMVTELQPPNGWVFTNLTCSDPDSGTTVSGKTANIDLDAGETVTCTYTNTICPDITLNPAAGALPAPVVNTPYSQTFTATGGCSSSFTYSLTSGALPNGLKLGADGVLTGTPTKPGTYDFTVTATDSCGCSQSQTYTLTANVRKWEFTFTEGMNEFCVWGGGGGGYNFQTTIDSESFGLPSNYFPPVNTSGEFRTIGLCYGRILLANDKFAFKYTFNAVPVAVLSYQDINPELFDPRVPVAAQETSRNVFSAGLSPIGLQLYFRPQSRIVTLPENRTIEK